MIHAHARGGFLVGLATARWLKRRVLFTNHMYARRVGMYRKAADAPRFLTVVLTPNMARHYQLTEEPPRVSVISACCDDRYFSLPLRLETGDTGAIRLVGVGNVMRWKNWHLMVEALVQLPEQLRARFEFSLWGPTYTDADSRSYEGEIRELIARHGLGGCVKLQGATHSVHEKLTEADWFVLPSTNEPCSVALTEALALGVPAIASASGGNVDIIEPGRTGLLFQPDDSADLARCLASIAGGKLAIKDSAAIRRSVRQRCATRVAAAYDPLYQHVAEDRPIDSPRRESTPVAPSVPRSGAVTGS